MGLSIINRKESGSAEAAEFKHKVKELKRIVTEICEDVESMEDEYGERSGYRGGYREGYRQGYDEAEMRRGRRY